jgi:hypothetical protein
MRGADVVIFEAATQKITDAHILQELRPIPDRCQNWSLRNYRVGEGWIIFEASRPLDTNDSQDRPLTLDDSSLMIPPHRIISAWGDSETYSYHGNNRPKGSVRFYGKDTGDAWETFRGTMDQEAEGYIDLVADDFLIPARETTYQTFALKKTISLQRECRPILRYTVLESSPL